jgi:hypothetical protein
VFPLGEPCCVIAASSRYIYGRLCLGALPRPDLASTAAAGASREAFGTGFWQVGGALIIDST